MRIDTIGNKIIEPNPNCDCGLTCGCEKCRPFVFKSKIKIWEGLEKWSKKAYKYKWIRKKDWFDWQELASSIFGHIKINKNK